MRPGREGIVCSYARSRFGCCQRLQSVVRTRRTCLPGLKAGATMRRPESEARSPKPTCCDYFPGNMATPTNEGFGPTGVGAPS